MENGKKYSDLGLFVFPHRRVHTIIRQNTDLIWTIIKSSREKQPYLLHQHLVNDCVPISSSVDQLFFFMSKRASHEYENKTLTSGLWRHFGFYCVFSVSYFKQCRTGKTCSIYWYRRNHERGSGLVLHCVHLDLCCCRHHLHAAGRPLLCSVHRRSPAHPHICWLGECDSLLCFFQVKEEDQS